MFRCCFKDKKQKNKAEEKTYFPEIFPREKIDGIIESMEIKNNNEAKTEKKTKDFGTFVILNQKSILNYLDEIAEKLEKDKEYREKMLKQIIPERKYKNTKKNQDYKIISRILKDEIGIQGVGETTIWRLLRIRKEAPDLYARIRENKISIRAAYSKAFGEEEKKKEEKPLEQQALITRGKLDFNKLQKELELVDAELDKVIDDETRQPDLKRLKQIDTELYKIRKKIGSLITENDPEKFV